VDEVTLGRMTIGAYLLGSSVLRAGRSAERLSETILRNELRAVGQAWRSRAAQAAAIAIGVVGLTVVVVAWRTSARPPEAAADDTDAPGGQITPGGRCAGAPG
jgi:hypothetical protein